MGKNTEVLLKNFCRYIYYTGLGYYWHKDIYKETIIYKMYSFITFTNYVVMVFLENLAVFIGVFPDVEKNSAIMFSAIHNIVLIKMFLVLYHKGSIKKFNKKISDIGSLHEETAVMNKQYKKVKYGLLLYVVSVYLSLFAFGVESYRKYSIEGKPFSTVVTYYPSYDDPSTIAFVLRVFFYITWLYMMLPMMSADCMPVVHLIIISFKFITLCDYFKRINEDFKRRLLASGKEAAVAKLKSDCMEGIMIHRKLITLTDEMNRLFGIIMSLQVCESSAVAVLLLLRLSTSMNVIFTDAVMTYTFIGSLFILLALNLWNAGEVTHQASLLSFEIYSCGWYSCELNSNHARDIKHMVLISSAQAQKPIVLKAFGIQDLSYVTFVSVAKMTYSICAVVYHRTKTLHS